MVWHLVLVLFIAGQQMEMVGTREFPSLAACNADIEKFANVQMRGGVFALTCIREDRA